MVGAGAARGADNRAVWAGDAGEAARRAEGLARAAQVFVGGGRAGASVLAMSLRCAGLGRWWSGLKQLGRAVSSSRSGRAGDRRPALRAAPVPSQCHHRHGTYRDAMLRCRPACDHALMRFVPLARNQAEPAERRTGPRGLAAQAGHATTPAG